MKLFNFGLLLCIVFIMTGCCEDPDGPYGPFKDTFPVTFNFDTVENITPTFIHTFSGPDVQLTTPEREAEINSYMTNAKNQVTYIKLLGPDQAEIKGKQKDGVTEIVLESKYTQSGSTYTFTKDIITTVLQYTSSRVVDTMSMKGLSCIRYNNGVRKSRSTVVEVSGYTLADGKATVEPADTLYYKVFDIRRLKEK